MLACWLVSQETLLFRIYFVQNRFIPQPGSQKND